MVDPDTVRALAVIDEWPARHASAAVVRPGHAPEFHGDPERPFPLASVTKVLVALAVLVATEERACTLDDRAGPPGSTVRHLLAHASGLAPDRDEVLAEPATRRIYSNRGFEVLGHFLARATSIDVPTYLHEAVVEPLDLRATALDGSPASGARASVTDLAIVANELLDPSVIARETLADATSVAFPGLAGVLPGFGSQDPNDWGLGVELRDSKRPHWTGSRNSPSTFGHFGQAGTMMWIDPVAGVGLVCLTDEPFGPWAATAWPALADAVLGEVSA